MSASQFVPVDATLIPTGALATVAGTDFDFRQPRRIGESFLASDQQRLARGYDHSLLIDAACRQGSVPAAKLRSADGRVTARLYTDRPALQFYSGQWLTTTLRRGGGRYAAHSGLALEPGVAPDSPHHPEWGEWSDCFAHAHSPPWRAWMRWEFEAH